MSEKLRSALLAAGVLLVVAIPAHADLYTYVDQQGTTHFSSAPLDSRYTRWSADNNHQVGTPNRTASAAITVPGQDNRTPVQASAPQPALPVITFNLPVSATRRIPAQRHRQQMSENSVTATPATANTAPSRAGFYSYTDAQGVVHFNSERRDSRYAWSDVGQAVTRQAKSTRPIRPRTLRRKYRMARADQSRHLIVANIVAARALPVEAAKSSNIEHARVKLAQNHFSPYQLPVARLHASMPYADLVQQAARKQGISSALVYSVIEVESHYQANAVSPQGAAGLMQLMPATARQYGAINRFDPKQNILAGTRYLKNLLHRFKGDLSLAVAAYNAGEGSVIRYGNHIPPFQETQHYVESVLTNYRRFLFG